MAAHSGPVVVLGILQAGSEEKRQKLLSLLRQQTPIFREPTTKSTTFLQFTPATRKGARLGMVPEGKSSSLAGVVEIYESQAALSSAIDKNLYKSYHATVKQEGLYEDGQQITIWHPKRGFISRGGRSPKGSIVMLAKFICKDGQTDNMVKVLGDFCDWVKDNEPGTLSYCAMTNPDAPNEVLMFERYAGLQVIGVHGQTKEFKTMFKSSGPFVVGKKTVLSEFEEVEGSFVSDVVGGGEEKAKL